MNGFYKIVNPLTVFGIQGTRRNMLVLKMMFLCWIFCKFWDMLFGYLQYITRNVKMFIWFASMLIIWRKVGYMYSLSTFFTVTKFCRWMKLSLLFPTIIIGRNISFLWMPIAFWIFFRRPMWLTVNLKHVFE